MMSSEDCWLKVALCEAKAELCSQPALKLAWLGLAVDWRDMAGDGDGTRTLARLMGRMRAPA